MKTKKCLYCCLPTENNSEYHEKCSVEFYGRAVPPILDFGLDDLSAMATIAIGDRVSVPGAQSKISLGYAMSDGKQKRMTVVGLWGEYILKPPCEEYPFMPENESLTMELADYFGIQTVPSSLIRLKTGELAYITKRIDRIGNRKLPMEDTAQLCGKLTEQKYAGSLEQVGKVIRQFSSNPGFDLLRFFELNVFSFLTGNADMHLKNFSIILQNGLYGLAPAYDLLSTRLLIPEANDREESALSMNGKKRKFNRDDFIKFSANLGLPEKAVQNSLSFLSQKSETAEKIISKCFLPIESRTLYSELIRERAGRIV